MFSLRRELCFLLAASSLCLLVSVCVAQEGFKHPSQTKFVPSFEMPSYTVVHTEKEFEIRSYKQALWVSSKKIMAKTYNEGANKGFLALFGYYNGANKQLLKINMTKPVLVDIEKSLYYTVYFYVPKKYQNGGLPAPLIDDVKQVKLPPKKYVAVRRFGGFLNTTDIPKEVAALKKSLQGTPYQRDFATDTITVAGYNSPFELTNRVNEVFLWFN